MLTQCFDKSAFTRPGYSGDSQAEGIPRQGKAGGHQLLGIGLMIGMSAFNEGDGPAQQSDIAVPYSLQELGYRVAFLYLLQAMNRIRVDRPGLIDPSRKREGRFLALIPWFPGRHISS